MKGLSFVAVFTTAVYAAHKTTLPVVNLNFTMVLQWINFGILLFLLYKLLYNPLIKALDERHNTIKKSLEEARLAKEEAEKLKEKWEKELQSFKEEKEKLLKEARKEAEDMKEAIVGAAYEEAKRVIEEVETMIRKAQDEMVKTVRAEAVKVAVDVARQLLAREVNRKVQEEIVKAFITKLSKQKK